MSKLRVVNFETGEDLSQDYTLRHRNQDAAFRNLKEKRGRGFDFTFSSMENMPEVIAKINEKHCGHLLYLQTFIDYDGIIVSATQEKAPMSKAEIQTALGLKKTAFYEFFTAMIDNGIIFEEGKVYRINPSYHFRGRTKNSRVIKTFSTKVRTLYTPANAKKLGFIYKVLPYVHYETNTVCANPYERDVEKIAQLSKNDIAELTSVSEKTVYSYLRKLKIGDEFVFAEIRRGSTRYYKINPFIFYRKDGEPDATLREMFRLGFDKK